MHLLSKIPIALRFWITDSRISDWADNTKIFFVLAIGRSGTKFLADLLDQSPAARVVHEPVRDDYLAHQKAFHSQQEAAQYIHRFRKKEMYLRMRDKQVDCYGEVNSLLRRHCMALKEAFPGSALVHLVRDGRDVVRSIISRKTMTPDDPHTGLICPTEEDPWKDEWFKMSRFERLCWYWQVENHHLRLNIEKRVQFERLIGSYDYLKKELLSPLGIDVPKNMWQAAVDSPKNVTDQYRIPHWSEWGDDRMASFRRICADEMRACGYE